MTPGAPHIVIAGGGMVGLSLALLLEQQLPGARITLVEKARLPGPGELGAYHPSFDARSTALSYSSIEVLRELGLWPALEPGLSPINEIHVSRRGRFGSSLLSSREMRWEALGWVVENAWLGRTLLAQAQRCERITLRCPAEVHAATPSTTGVQVQVGEEAIHADLLVVADGAESRLRESLGFFTRRKRYGQDALIANIAFPRDHDGVAYERFTASGPLALLPLTGADSAPCRMALVWTLPPDDARRLGEIDEAAFARELVQAFGYRLGRPQRVGDRSSYPLVLTEAVEQARRGVVVLGNAAHALHPVAGQGFNLALRDAAQLCRTLRRGLDEGTALGDTGLLGDYLRQRQDDQARTIAASDGLPALFMSADPLLSLGRDLALAGMDFLPAARRYFVEQAAGVAALRDQHG